MIDIYACCVVQYMSLCLLVSYVCLQINELCMVCVCSSCDKVNVSLLLMLLSLLLSSLHDQNIDWIIWGFWRTMMIILFFSLLWRQGDQKWAVLYLLLFFFSCRSSFSFSVFLHLITIAVFIQSLGLPPTRICRNIKTSSSSSLLSFRRPFQKFKRIHRQ